MYGQPTGHCNLVALSRSYRHCMLPSKVEGVIFDVSNLIDILPQFSLKTYRSDLKVLLSLLYDINVADFCFLQALQSYGDLKWSPFGLNQFSFGGLETLTLGV